MSKRHDYPNDADGDALRRLANGGSDMQKPMTIDFAVAVANSSAAKKVRGVASQAGYEPRVVHDEGGWTVYCSKSMVADYAGVVEAQNELNGLSEPFGGYCDGWGSFGNIN